MRRWIAAVVVVVALAAGVALLSGWIPRSSGEPGGSGATPPPVPRADLVIAEARAVPAVAATVVADVPGSVVRIAVEEGAPVAAGDVLLQLDDEAAQAEVAAASAAVAGAEAALDGARASASQAAAEVERATGTWRAAKAARDQLGSGSTAAQRRQADANREAAAAGIDAARAARSAAEAGIASAEAALERARAGLTAAEAALARLTVVAPIAGTVADLPVDAGGVVAVGSPVARIAGAGGWQFETTDLTQDEAAVVRVGAPVTVVVDGFDEEPVTGSVTRIGEFGEDRQGDVVFTVVITPQGDVPAGLRWGMLASAEIDAAR